MTRHKTDRVQSIQLANEQSSLHKNKYTYLLNQNISPLFSGPPRVTSIEKRTPRSWAAYDTIFATITLVFQKKIFLFHLNHASFHSRLSVQRLLLELLWVADTKQQKYRTIDSLPTITCKNDETLHILWIFFTSTPPSPHYQC